MAYSLGRAWAACFVAIDRNANDETITQGVKVEKDPLNELEL